MGVRLTGRRGQVKRVCDGVRHGFAARGRLDVATGKGHSGNPMRIYKILRAGEWAELLEKGATDGAPVDKADGFVHFSTAEQVAETAARHFAGEDGLILAAFEADDLGAALVWEPSRGGALFPHLYGPLRACGCPVARAPAARRRRPCLPGGALGHVGTLRPFGHAPDGPRARPCAGHRGAEDRDAAAFGAGHLAAARDDAGGARTCPTPSASPPGSTRTPRPSRRCRGPVSAFSRSAAPPRGPRPATRRPRLFRLTEDAAAINRFGFNNDGMEAIAARLAEAPRTHPGGPQPRRQQGQPRPRPGFRSGADLLRPACGFRYRQRLLAQHRTAARPAGARRARGAAGRA
jgi:uncharacterized protein (DUF952 family)